MRTYAGSARMLVTTMVAAVGCYTINLKVSSERAGVESLRTQLVSDAREMRNLQAELRTRARFPELQRWNDNVLQMSAPVAGQFLRSPLQLASYAAAPAAAKPGLVYTVTTPESVAPMTAPLVEIAYNALPAGEARLIRAGYSVPQRTPVPEVAMAAPLQPAALVEAMAVRTLPVDATASRRAPADVAASRRVPADVAASRRAPAVGMASRTAPAAAIAPRTAPAVTMIPARIALKAPAAKPERLQTASAENRAAAPLRPAPRRVTPAQVETPRGESSAASPAPGAPVDLLPKGGL